MRAHLLSGDVMSIPLADQSVHCIITSPPYWGLRDYGTGKWEGGDPDCDHVKPTGSTYGSRSNTFHGSSVEGILAHKIHYKDICKKCGAVRVDKQLGSEPTHDCGAWVNRRGIETGAVTLGGPCGSCFVCNVRRYAREFWRILRDDGSLWLNLGDSYVGGGRGGNQTRFNNAHSGVARKIKAENDLKPKDLVGIPWRVALALQADGWYLRSDIIWAKPNPMPESVTDRPSKAHEYIFLLTKNKRYFYDADAVREPIKPESIKRVEQGIKTKGKTKDMIGDKFYKGQLNAMTRSDGSPKMQNNPSGRNRRTVWNIPTAPYKGSHFATFPPKLIEPMIKAATSERGVCPICGKQWVRVTETERSNYKSFDHPLRTGGAISGGVGKNFPETTRSTVGWKPQCEHDADPIPAVVFDPFLGSGTSVMMANKLGRRGVGLDLSLEYIELAKERVGIKALEQWENGIDASEPVDLGPMFDGLSSDPQDGQSIEKQDHKNMKVPGRQPHSIHRARVKVDNPVCPGCGGPTDKDDNLCRDCLPF